MMIVMIFFCSILIMINHPLPMSIFLVLNTIFMSLFMIFCLNILWQSMIMFLILVGGILILFLYMSSISPNSKFISNKKAYIVISFMILFLINLSLKENPWTSNLIILSDMYLYNIHIIIFLIFYLLYTLVVVSFINKIYLGPLRSNYV